MPKYVKPGGKNWRIKVIDLSIAKHSDKPNEFFS